MFKSRKHNPLAIFNYRFLLGSNIKPIYGLNPGEKTD